MVRALGALVLCALGASANVIGIDYGTETMKVALVQPGSPLEIVTNHVSKRKTETALAFVRGERLFGSDAYGMLSRKPELAYARLTELLGRTAAHAGVLNLAKSYMPMDVKFNETRGGLSVAAAKGVTEDYRAGGWAAWAVEELVAMVLTYAKDITRAFGGHVVRDCVITVPAYATQLEREAMLSAAELAELRVLTLFDENTAAALHFGLDRLYSEPTRVLFYNLGAEAAQVSIVEYSTFNESKKVVGQLEVLGKGWEHGVGGFAIDLAIAELVADGFNAKWGKGDVRTIPRAMAKIREASKKCKEVLSANAEIPISIMSLHADIDFSMVFSRSKLEAAAAGIFERLGAPILMALREAKMTADEVDAVEIIGGGVRVPKVQQTLKDFFKTHCTNVTKQAMELGGHLNGDEAVALGAAFHGANVSTSFRVRKVGLIDHTPYAVGIKMDNDPLGKSAKDVLEAEGKTALLGGFFGGGAAAAKAASERYEAEAKDWQKRATLFKAGATLGGKPRIIAFQHDADIVCELLYEETDKLEAGVPRTLALYNISGIAAFAAEMAKMNATGALPRPKVQLSFLLDSSGISQLLKAEVSVVEEYEVEVVPEPVKAKKEDKKKDKKKDEKKKGDETETTEETVPDEEPTVTTEETVSDEAPTENATAAENATVANATMVTKKKTHKKTLTVLRSTHGMAAWAAQAGDLDESRARLAAISAAENIRIEREGAKNDLEGTIYATRTAVDEREDLAAVSTAEQRDAVSARSAELEEWLGDAGAEVPLAEFKANRAELAKLLSDIVFRADEASKRPAALKKARKALADAKRNATEVWPESKPWLNATDLEDLVAKVTKVEEWLEEKASEQAKLEAHAPPAFAVEDIQPRLKPVAALAARLLLKAKPLPPKPTVNETDANATATDANATNADENATRPDGAAEPEAAEAWDEL